MRLPPSVVSLIEAHLTPPSTPKSVQPSFKAFAANLQPFTPGSTSTPKQRANINPQSPQNATITPRVNTRATTRHDTSRYQPISLHGALERYPQNSKIALGAAHRLLDDQLAAPSTSSLVRNLIKRQDLYERIIRMFSQHPQIAQVTIASVYQRMITENVPPSTNILKLVLSMALKNDTPIVPILRVLLANDGIPEKMDTHLLLLIMKGLIREVDMKPKILEQVIEDCLSAAGIGERPIEFDEILIEAYGKKGDLRGVITLLARHKQTTHTAPGSRPPILSLYLEALTQWIENPMLRRKRRGSLFPRALAKDLIEIYGGPEKMPLEWLNCWMNGERVAGNLETALNVWEVITSLPTQPDCSSYSTYLKLIKLLPASEARPRLRQIVRDITSPKSMLDLNPIILENTLGAAFTHYDLPLVLHLVRQLDYSPDQHHPSKLSATARMIDIIAAGIIRLHRAPLTSTQSRSNALSPEEWRGITELVQMESRQLGKESNITLPLSRPQASMVPDEGSGDYIGHFKPRSGTQTRASLVLPLTRLLEQAMIHRYRVSGEAGGDEEILKKVMADLHMEILP